MIHANLVEGPSPRQAAAGLSELFRNCTCTGQQTLAGLQHVGIFWTRCGFILCVCTNCYKGWQLSNDRSLSCCRKDLRQQEGQLPANKLEATKSPLKHRHIAGSWPGLISCCLWPQVVCWVAQHNKKTPNTQGIRALPVPPRAPTPASNCKQQGLSPRAPIPTSSTILAQSKTAIHISQKGSNHFLLVHASYYAHGSWYCCQSPEPTYHHKLLPGARVCLQSIRSS